MNEAQKKAATAVSLFIVAGAAFFFLWLALEVMRGTVDSRSGPGKQFMLAVANLDGLGIALKSLPILLSIGLSFVGRYVLKDWLFYGLVALSALGGAAAIYLYWQMGSDSTEIFWRYPTTDSVQDPKAIVAAAHKGLGIVIAWFVAVILAELGIKKVGFQ